MNGIYFFGRMAEEFSDLIKGAKRINQWGIKPEDKKTFLKFLEQVPSIPDNLPPAANNYIASIFPDTYGDYEDFRETYHLHPSLLGKFIRDLEALMDFGWLAPFKEWPEHDLLVAEPSIYYRDYVEKGILAVLTDCTDYMDEFIEYLAIDGWVLKTEEGLQDYLRIIDYLNGDDAYNKLMEYVYMQSLLDAYGLLGFKWESPANLSIRYDTFHFRRTANSVQIIMPDYLREQGLGKRFPLKVFKYLCENHFHPDAILGENPSKHSKTIYADPNVLQSILREAMSLPKREKSQWSFQSFCEWINDNYCEQTKAQLTASKNPHEIRKAVVRKFGQAGLPLGPWILKAPSELTDIITDPSRSLLQCSKWMRMNEWTTMRATKSFSDSAFTLIGLHEPLNPLFLYAHAIKKRATKTS